MVRKALGRGLEALISQGVEAEVPILPELRAHEPRHGEIQHVPLAKITRNPSQPRSQFAPDLIRELAASIRERGVLQPVLLRPHGDGYQIVAGERRFLATTEAGFSTIPAIVRPLTDREALLIALIENLQRENLNPLEEAEGFRQLADDFDLSHDQIAGLIGRSRSDVSNTLRLLKLSSGVREALAEGQISAGHARALLGLGAAQDQTAALRTVLGKGLNVRQTEALIRQLGAGPRRQRATPRQGAEAAALESQLEAELGTRVRIKGGPRGGQVIIHYYSDEELNAIADRLLSKERARK